jgi:hypothetical protein
MNFITPAADARRIHTSGGNEYGHRRRARA